MRPLLDLILGGKIRKQTRRYLADVAAAPARTSRKEANQLLKTFRASGDSHLTIGTTTWGEAVTVPLKELMCAHSIVTGGTGAGKTRFALNIIRGLLQKLPQDPGGLGVIDPKGDLFSGALLLVWQRLQELSKRDPEAAHDFQRRVVILDFSTTDPPLAYNILAKRPRIDAGYFASTRADLLLDLLPSGEGLSLGASALLTKVLLLLSEFNLPITWLSEILYNGDLRDRVLHRSQQPELKIYFTHQFAQVPRQTISALSRRVEALFSSESVRLALSGQTAPDMRALQDDGRIVLVNCFGEHISRSVRQLLQALVCTDIAQSIFARKRRDLPFLWVCDEAQHFFGTPRLRDHIEDVLTMSRSFGTFLCSLTQNLGSAVHDAGLLHSLQTNTRWSFSMRDEPSDCAFLKPAMPITGRKLQPQSDPFKEPTYYSMNDERTAELNAVANLPDRTGWFWYRPHSSEAIKITTADLTLPSGEAVGQSMKSLMSDPNFGMRISRQEYDRHVDARKKDWEETPASAELDQVLAQAYQRVRGSKP